ncbi:MAG TPA: hypothetical protein VNA25_20220 [Phycisphaerae bacterium]|nr:hypothetical protein [Phycisphaerae bacterium]
MRKDRPVPPRSVAGPAFDDRKRDLAKRIGKAYRRGKPFWQDQIAASKPEAAARAKRIRAAREREAEAERAILKEHRAVRRGKCLARLTAGSPPDKSGWYARHVIGPGKRRHRVFGWVLASIPDEVAAAEAWPPKPVSLPMKCFLLAALHDSALEPADPILPRSLWTPRAAVQSQDPNDLFLLRDDIAQLSRLHDGGKEAEDWLASMESWLDDVRIASKRPQPSLAEKIVNLCEEMLRLGREPGSGSSPIVMLYDPARPYASEKQRAECLERLIAAAQPPAVGEHRHTPAPSDSSGHIGMACYGQWTALAQALDERGERLVLQRYKLGQ